MKLFLILFLFIFNKALLSQDTLLFNADYIPYTDTTLVFVPSDYDSNKIYPLLFMLHGWAGNYNQWNEIINLKNYADNYQFIIVCPDGFYDSWYIDSPVKNKSQFETFFFKKLVPYVTSNYSIDWGNIFITGLSMGGHGAIFLMLKNPGFFTSAGSTSGILDITLFPEEWGLKNVLGPLEDNTNEWFRHSCLYNLINIEWSYKPIIIDCGTDDFALEANKRFVDLCKIYGVKASNFFEPGDHSEEYWQISIDKHFRFFKSLSIKKYH